MDSVTFRRMTSQDAPQCHKLELALFPEDSPWSQAAFTQVLGDVHSRYFIAENLEIIGYAGIVLSGGIYRFSEIHTIAVAQDFQGKGVGRKLLALLLDCADQHGEETFLEVRADNTAAINLYTSVGFETIGVRKNYYQPSGADAYSMRRRISL